MDLPEIAQYAAALLVVIALILALHWALRRFFGGATERAPGPASSRRRERRLGVVEAAQVGPRHRLLLVRRDDREHLILIGGASELVIETDIPHATDADVNIRSVEPRFGEEAGEDRRDDRGYRPADEFEPRVSIRRAPMSPGFGAAFPEREEEDEDDDVRPYARFEDDARPSSRLDEDVRPSSRFDLDEREERERDEPFAARRPFAAARDDDEDEDYGRDAPPPRPFAGRERGGERDEVEATESRILNRFLKRDGP